MASTFSRTYSTLALVAAVAAAPLAAHAATQTATQSTTQAATATSSDGGVQQHQKMMRRGHKGHDGWGSPMLRKLNLSQAQQDQIFKIRHDQAQAFYDQHKALKQAAKSLRDITTADTFDQAKAQQAASAVGAAESQLALLRAQTQAQIRAVLTPEQRQKLAERWQKHHKDTKETTRS